MINNYPIINIYEKSSLKSKLSSQLLYGEKFKVIKKKKMIGLKSEHSMTNTLVL